jgi:hypothetical protein
MIDHGHRFAHAGVEMIQLSLLESVQHTHINQRNTFMYYTKKETLAAALIEREKGEAETLRNAAHELQL